MEILVCNICGDSYEYTFAISRRRGDRRTVCSSCWQKRKRRYRKEQCLAYKGGKCERCGYSKCNRALEFHHINPKEKLFEVGDFITNSWEKVKTELDKCQLLCSNCHAEIEESLVLAGSSNSRTHL